MSCAVPRSTLVQPVSEIETALEALASSHDNLHILRIFETLCPATQENCYPSSNGVFTMRDSDHLNA